MKKATNGPAKSKKPQILSEHAPIQPVQSRIDRLGGMNSELWMLLIALLPVFGLFVYHASVYYWQCDDAYISYRYVRNFVNGDGLVFNRGDRVEGYTNFLWVLMLAGIWKVFGQPPEIAIIPLTGLFTIGTVLITAALCMGSHIKSMRMPMVWGALFYLASNRTFAVWSSSGLEARQFTFFLLLAVWLLRAYPSKRASLLYASCALGMLELARPEGLMILICCVFWYLLDSLHHKRFAWKGFLQLVLPAGTIILFHYIWRYQYYGDWLPNTYYAKHIRPWPDSGITYYISAALENGVYIIVPFAVAGLISRYASTGDTTHILSFILIAAHVLYIVRIGGDHFEYRPLDFY